MARTILGPGARVLDLLPDLRLPSSLSKDVSLESSILAFQLRGLLPFSLAGFAQPVGELMQHFDDHIGRTLVRARHTPISPLLRDLVGTLGSDDQLEMVACIAWSHVE